MNDNEVFKLIEKEILKKKYLNNPYDETYVRRLELYPEFLQMPYWLDYREYIDIKEYLNEVKFKGKILDFGCGSGHMDILLGRDGYEICGVDLSPMAIGICNILRDNELNDIKKKVSFKLEDVTSLNVSKDMFDLVWCSHTLEHIKDHKPIFEGLKKRISKNAKMRISVPLGYAFDDPDHVHHWANEKEFREYFERMVLVEEVIVDENKRIIVATFKL
ncbi:class I SAM-dependent methyltransferase [uncultured Clostridium sp.]|jgi:2-polyprenyl-3-methyl-5-hydroxy-6-metoxy-1,4-benzoquinol methylase|uniref:class I SAM-dependent methyltransferase n=1 Tax=uncultured Clostridium sp. TaxID=59620 RepID=UPI00262ADB46|nr:class I SAM-dependent methyltransferase [uncultured Clostridium sp.]